MASRDDKVFENSKGRYYVDSQCIGCNMCVETASQNFIMHESGSYAYVNKQPSNAEEENLCAEAMRSCPVEAIGNDGEGD